MSTSAASDLGCCARASVLFNFEWLPPASAPSPFAGFFNADTVRLHQHYHVWDYSVHNQRVWSQHGVNASLVPLGYSEHLTNTAISSLPEAEKDIDVLCFGAFD